MKIRDWHKGNRWHDVKVTDRTVTESIRRADWRYMPEQDALVLRTTDRHDRRVIRVVSVLQANAAQFDILDHTVREAAGLPMGAP